MTQAGRDDRGSLVLELVIFIPIVIAVLAIIILAGRRNAAQGDVTAAAQSAARAISIARDPNAAVPAAEAAAREVLDVGTVRCQEMSFEPVIDVDQVEVTITCVADTSDLAAALPIPGTHTLTGTAVEVFDVYREPAP